MISTLSRFFASCSIFYKNIPKPSTIPIVLKETEIEEKFVKGGGRGGQKINKTNNLVQLKHLPTGIIIETQRFRELSANRKEARKLLTLKLDQLYNGSESKLALKAKKMKKQLAKKKARTNAKYHGDTKNGDGAQPSDS